MPPVCHLATPFAERLMTGTTRARPDRRRDGTGGAMAQGFDERYWDAHWQQVRIEHRVGHDLAPNPYLVCEATGLAPGTALEAGCGEGAEALWLAGPAGRWPPSTSPPNPCPGRAGRALKRCAERSRCSGCRPSELLGTHAAPSTWSPPTTPTRQCRSSLSTTGSPTGWHPAAPSSSSGTYTPTTPRATDTRPRPTARTRRALRGGVGDRRGYHSRVGPRPVGRRHRRRTHPDPGHTPPAGKRCSWTTSWCT